MKGASSCPAALAVEPHSAASPPPVQLGRREVSWSDDSYAPLEGSQPSSSSPPAGPEAALPAAGAHAPEGGSSEVSGAASQLQQRVPEAAAGAAGGPAAEAGEAAAAGGGGSAKPKSAAAWDRKGSRASRSSQHSDGSASGQPQLGRVSWSADIGSSQLAGGCKHSSRLQPYSFHFRTQPGARASLHAALQVPGPQQ